MGRLSDRVAAPRARQGGHPAGDIHNDPNVSPDLQWLATVLWGGRPGVVVSRSPEPPPGRRAAGTYIVLPNLRRPRLLVRAGPRRAARRALASYNGLRPPATRLARALLGAGLGMGLPDRLFRDRLTVWLPEGFSAEELPSLLLSEHVRQVLGRDDQVMEVIGLRPRGPYTKPVLQLFGGQGDPLAYVKVGWNEVTSQLVRNEATFLHQHRDHHFPNLRIPRLIHHGRWHDLDIAIALPLPTGMRRYRPPTRVPPLEIMREIAESSGLLESPFATSTYWRRTRRTISRLLADGPARDADIVTGFVRRIEEHYGDAAMLFGRWHGDWAPWNLAWLDRTLVAWDWEHTAEDVPLGFDAVNFLFQSHFAWKQESLAASTAACRHGSRIALRALGVRPALQPLVLSAYLLEMYIRYSRARLGGAGVNERFYPAILDLFTSRLSTGRRRGEGRFNGP